jgi:acyl-[acyl-carrier-protein]-phospholipid O-acyltransferase / long-chain-fatty-acid--[acyl-carrier-protein] ligase
MGAAQAMQSEPAKTRGSRSTRRPLGCESIERARDHQTRTPEDKRMQNHRNETEPRRRKARELLHLKALRSAKRRWFSVAMSDVEGRKVTWGKMISGALLLSRILRKLLPRDSAVGVLLPPSPAGAILNVALLFAGKIPVNLNYTAGKEAMHAAIRQAGIVSVVSSKKFLSRVKVESMPGLIHLEDLISEAPQWRKLATYLLALILPARWLEFLYNRAALDPQGLATVIFSSGSTGEPKGVMLSHHSVLSNIEGIVKVFRVTHEDLMAGVLPFFHAFGFTGTLWLPLVSGFGAAYHVNPLDGKTIGEMVSRHRATILISTPSCYAAYLRQCTAKQFSSLRYAIAGGEKLQGHVARAFKEKYGLDLLEGYGCSEAAPVVSVNFPDAEGGPPPRGLKRGSVGRPLPGIAAMIVDPSTGEPRPAGEEGLLLVKGPNLMLGYLGKPKLTEEVFRDGWYVTGDIAFIDEDGFITITDRLTRFSKIAGEMVPHVKVEEALEEIVGDLGCAVTAVPDPRKGESLVVLYSHPSASAEELWERLCRSELPRLWIPRRDHFYRVSSVPLLGSGKKDLAGIKAMAVQCALGGR